MIKKYVDYKQTIWQRAWFNDEADMSKIQELIKENGDIDYIFDDKLGFSFNECLYDTTTNIDISDNKGNSTIEIYENDEIVWENGDKNLII